MPAGAWGSKKPSDAIRAPPPPGGRGGGGSSGGRGGGRGGGGGGRGGQQQGRGRGGGRGGRGNNNNNNQNQQYNRTILNVDLLLPGEGTTDLQKAVKRWTAPEMLKHRLNYVTPPTTTSKDDDDAWEPPNHCAWVDDNRIEEITNIANTPSKLGDVSRIRRTPTVKETAPALEDCKPLEVNDGTRWKSKVFDGQNKSEQAGAGDGEVAAVSDDAILKKALLILNKLSLTKFEKLSEEFVNTGIGQNGTTLSGAVNMIVDKAQSEPHFASMYAQLCLYLSKVPMDESVGGKKAFKKLLLSRCQAEFEEEMSTKIIKAMEGITDVDEQAYHEGLLKKKYLGHMRFIGELYKGDLIKLEVMLFCLNTLLLDEHEHDDHTENHNQHYYDEEKVECFAKLITTVGFPLEQQSYMYSQAGKPNPQAQLDACWHKVESIAQQQETSARIKFMLLDLKEMKNNGWITRRKEETAKTIDQIHKEVAREEAQAARSSRSSSTRSSMPNVRRSTNDLRKATGPDQDGFTVIVPMSRSSGNLMRSTSDAQQPSAAALNRPKVNVRRAQSMTVKKSTPPVAAAPAAPPKTSLKEVETKAKNALKEFFAIGDMAEAVLSIDEVVGGSEENGAKVVEACIFLVMERKPEDVDKMLVVMRKVHEQKKISDKAFLKGLDDPLEFLSDIEIDAPLARKFLTKIVADFATFCTSESFEAAAAGALLEKK